MQSVHSAQLLLPMQPMLAPASVNCRCRRVSSLRNSFFVNVFAWAAVFSICAFLVRPSIARNLTLPRSIPFVNDVKSCGAEGLGMGRGILFLCLATYACGDSRGLTRSGVTSTVSGALCNDAIKRFIPG